MSSKEESEIGGFQWIGKALKGGKVLDVVSVKFQHDIARLQPGRFGQASLFDICHHHAAAHRQIHLARQRGRHIVEDHTGKGMDGGGSHGSLNLLRPFTRGFLNDQFRLIQLPFSDEIHAMFAADRRLRHQVPQMAAIHHISPVEPHHDIAPLETGLFS